VPIATQAFGQCVSQLLREKKISASELARMMAYKSRNSIFRILDGEGAHGARQAFFLRLREENPLNLGEKEFEWLEEALELSRVGAVAYRSNLAMRELLTGADEVQETMRIAGQDGKDGWPILHRALEAPKLEVIIFGCCERRILSAIRRRLRERSVPDGVRVIHFIYTGQEELVHAISAVQPMLYADFYTAYCVEPGVFSKAREQIYRSNAVCLRWMDGEGSWHHQSFILVDTDLFCALGGVQVHEHAGLDKLFKADLEKMTALKMEFSSEDGVPDYVAYTDMCRRFEQSRAIYTTKLDMSFPYIDTDILVGCAMESYIASGMEPEEAERIVGALKQVHERRFENIYSKKKPTHTIFSVEFMERFARTGRQTDHFFGLRPYTPAERVKILQHILEQTQSNPSFDIYFFKPDFEPPLMEITLYEGLGTMMTKPFTDYNLAGDHAEAMTTNAEFCARYKTFFTEDLLARQVMTREETIRELERLIEIAGEA